MTQKIPHAFQISKEFPPIKFTANKKYLRVSISKRL